MTLNPLLKDLWKLHCPECGAVVNSRTSWTWIRANSTKSCESCGIPLKKITTNYRPILPMTVAFLIIFFTKLPEPYGQILLFCVTAATLILAGMEVASTQFVRREDENILRDGSPHTTTDNETNQIQ